MFLSLIFVFSLVSFAMAQFSFGSGTFRNPYDDLYSGSPLLEFHADILDGNMPSMTRDTLIIDFESRKVTFSRVDKLTGMPLWEFHYAEMEDYFRDMENHARNSLWNEIARERGRTARADNRPGTTGLAFAIPANLPRWATRILGQEPPKLSITGTQRIYLGVQRTMSGTRDEPENRQTSPEFKPTSNFNIRGSVGRLLHLEINLQSDGDDDFFEQAKNQLSQVRIHYREEIPGELEDDIIQEVEIGKTSFQMPGQGLAGYSSGSNENLFGIRVRSKFGPLELTTIASIENVEAQRKTIDRNQGTSESTMSELEYAKNQFFYLDDIYRRRDLGENIPVPPVIPERVQIFRKINHVPSNEDIRYAFYEGGGGQAHIFRRLRDGVDYVIHRNRPGVIQFLSRLGDSETIGVISHIEGLQKGDTTAIPITLNNGETRTAYTNLWILKNDNARIGDSTYNLTLRNVYFVGSADQTSFNIRVERVSSDGSTHRENDVGESFTDILGLSDREIILSSNSNIFDLENGFMYIPPFITTDENLNGNWVFTNPRLGESGQVPNVNPNIYDDSQTTPPNPNFRITTTSRRRMDRFQLDFGVVEGSERLWTPGGDTLIRNIDYSIDYSFGEVNLLSDKARHANVIEAEYQKESLFLLDRKVFIGINAKLDLPGIGRNSFWSTTLMWQLMDAKKMMPRVGTEPYNRFLFGSSLRLDFAPLWMTSAINYIPLIEREAQSTATFDFEVAHSSAKNSARSGGEAFIDNFSGSARIFPLSLSHINWYRAAPDRIIFNDFINNPPVWHQYWYMTATGDDRSNRREIYEPENLHSFNDKMNTLRFVVHPLPEDSSLLANIVDGNGDLLINPHAGISYGFPSTFMNRSEDRYFEFWIRKGSSSTRGKLTIDFGEVAQNTSLDGREPGRTPGTRNNHESLSNTISPELDLGLNRLKDEYEYWFYPNFSDDPRNPTWDSLHYGDSRLGMWIHDPARDNWALYDRDNLHNRIHANGTQGNGRVDREDFDGNGIVITADEQAARYFRYTINLDSLESSPFRNHSQTANESGSGWIHIRIPVGDVPPEVHGFRLGDYEEWGTPDWRTIRQVRMLWTGMAQSINSRPDSLEFEGIQFVGNQWKEQIYEPDTVVTGKVTASILDSRTTPGYSPPRMKRLDSLGGEQATDYSLRLEYSGIKAQDSAFVSKRFEASQAMNLSNYRAIKFWAKDVPVPGRVKDINSRDSIWFVLRFGSDSLTYYEFKTRRLRVGANNFGWDNEGFTINLEDLTRLKLAWFNTKGERYGSINTATRTPEGDSLKVYTETRIAPTLSNITWIAFGVHNDDSVEYSGDVRINGFRATGISDYSGWAVRANMRLSWSDFLENSADFRYTDAGFRSMSDDILRESSAQLNSGFSSKIQLDRFFPDRFGLQIPLGGEISASLQRPEIRPNSDIPLRNSRGESDGLRDMGGDFARIITNSAESSDNVTASQEYERRGRRRSAYTGYRKNRTSEGVVPRLTADRISVDYRLSYRDSLARMGLVPNDEREFINREGFEVYHAEINVSQQHNMRLDYNFSPSPRAIETLSWMPFRDHRSPTLSRRIKTMSFNLLPERVMFDIADVNYARREQYSSIQDAVDTTGQYFLNRRPIEEVGIVHGLNITHRPINPFLTVNYNLGVNRNFDHFIRTWGQSGVGEFARTAVFSMDNEYAPYNVLFSEQRRNQDLRIAFTPEITRWLTFSSNAGGGYTQNMRTVQDRNTDRDAVYMETNINSSFDFNTLFNIRRLFEDFSRTAKRNEGFSTGLANIAKGFETVGFENLNFGYRANMALGGTLLDMDYLDYGLDRSRAKFMLYSLGVYNRSFSDFVTGNMNDSQAFGGVQNRNDWYEEGDFRNDRADRRSTTQSVNASTSMRIPNPVEISINTISLGWSRNYSITQDVDRLDTVTTFPDFRIGASSSALEQLEMIRQNFSAFRLDWGYRFRKENALSGIPSSRVEIRETIGWGLDPLIRTTLRLRRIGLDFSYGLNLGFDSTATYDSLFVAEENNWETTKIRSSHKRTVGNEWTAGYHVQGRRGRTIRLFRDQVVEIRGDMDYSVSIEYIRTFYKYPHQMELTGEDGNYDDLTVFVRPQVAYRFTRNIDAILFYQLNRSVTGRDKFLSHNGRVAMEITISF